jgi:hypothetical protein
MNSANEFFVSLKLTVAAAPTTGNAANRDAEVIAAMIAPIAAKIERVEALLDAAAAPTLTPENLLTLSRQLADLVRGTATIPIREPRTSPESSNGSQRMSVLDHSSNDSQTSYSSRMNIAASEICDTAENIDEEI